jgi:parvulin-like peptidyl-prolyl isomerase
MRDTIIVSFMRSSFVGQNVSVSPGAVRRTFEEKHERYRGPEKLRLRMIVLRKEAADKGASAKTLADAIMDKLAAGEDFGLLAKKHSTGDKANAGGDWGWIEAKFLRPELAKAAASLKAGEVAKPIDTDAGIYILRVDERRGTEEAGFEELHGGIERALWKEEAERLNEAWIDRLKRRTYVRVFDTGLF